MLRVNDVLVMLSCRRCRAPFFLCHRDYRGQAYCGDHCRLAARALSAHRETATRTQRRGSAGPSRPAACLPPPAAHPRDGSGFRGGDVAAQSIAAAFRVRRTGPKASPGWPPNVCALRVQVGVGAAARRAMGYATKRRCSPAPAALFHRHQVRFSPASTACFTGELHRIPAGPRDRQQAAHHYGGRTLSRSSRTWPSRQSLDAEIEAQQRRRDDERRDDGADAGGTNGDAKGGRSHTVTDGTEGTPPKAKKPRG